MGYCYNCRSWKQNKGTLEQQLFGECTDKHFINMTQAHSMTNIDGAGFIGPNMEGVKFITGKKFGCPHFDRISPRERDGYEPRKKIVCPKLKITLKNEIKGTTHLVRTYDGLLNHPQVYNAMRMLCGDVYCTRCDVAGCYPFQVEMISRGERLRDSIYQINQKDIAEAVSRREGKQK